ncbi:MAG: carboxypeptidase regulatory-like domain-containing protein, partial [Calditrichaeota bacterium]|nr:carboxypeptidase regulatory-like domain-containing protein [Calditrichota bacterium]
MIAKTLRHTLPLMLLFPLLLFSQQPNTVTIFGTVSDRASGAGLAGVRVEVISEADSSERAAAISDSSGAYRITLSLGAARAGGTPQDF